MILNRRICIITVPLDIKTNNLYSLSVLFGGLLFMWQNICKSLLHFIGHGTWRWHASFSPYKYRIYAIYQKLFPCVKKCIVWHETFYDITRTSRWIWSFKISIKKDPLNKSHYYTFFFQTSFLKSSKTNFIKYQREYPSKTFLE